MQAWFQQSSVARMLKCFKVSALLVNKVTFSSFDLWFFVQQRRKQLSRKQEEWWKDWDQFGVALQQNCFESQMSHNKMIATLFWQRVADCNTLGIRPALMCCCNRIWVLTCGSFHSFLSHLLLLFSPEWKCVYPPALMAKNGTQWQLMSMMQDDLNTCGSFSCVQKRACEILQGGTSFVEMQHELLIAQHKKNKHNVHSLPSNCPFHSHPNLSL